MEVAGWCKAHGERQQSQKRGHQTDYCRLSSAVTWGSLFLLVGRNCWWSSNRDPEPETLALLHPRYAMISATSLSENKVFSGTRSFFRTGSARLRKYAKILQLGYCVEKQHGKKWDSHTWLFFRVLCFKKWKSSWMQTAKKQKQSLAFSETSTL